MSAGKINIDDVGEAPGMSDWAWSIIERSGRDSKKMLRIAQEELSEEELELFQKEVRSAASWISDGPYLARLSEAGESEDGVSDVTEWVVCLGRETYDAVREDPDRILRYLYDEDAFSVIGLIYVVLGEKYGRW